MVIIAAVKKVRKNMLTVKQVAERLGVGESSVRHWRIAGRFPGAEAEESPRGIVWYIPESDLKGFQVRRRGRPPKKLAVAEKPGKKTK
jgi:transposase-like protein